MVFFVLFSFLIKTPQFKRYIEFVHYLIPNDFIKNMCNDIFRFRQKLSTYVQKQKILQFYCATFIYKSADNFTNHLTFVAEIFLLTNNSYQKVVKCPYTMTFFCFYKNIRLTLTTFYFQLWSTISPMLCTLLSP